MKLQEIYNHLADKVSDITLYKALVKTSSEKELRKAIEQIEATKNIPGWSEMPASGHGMYFTSPRTGNLVPFGHRELSQKEAARLIIEKKNKQYCWLLAEAYEAFEDFLDMAYAYLAAYKPDRWSQSHLNKTGYELYILRQLPFNYFLKIVHGKNISPKKIVSTFRNLYPELVDIETRNQLQVNLRVAIRSIEQLRHHIVHTRGLVRDRSIFIEKVLNDCGLWNGGSYNPTFDEFFVKLFGTDNYNEYIVLLEPEFNTGTPITISHDKFGMLTGYLLAYATEICLSIQDDEASQWKPIVPSRLGKRRHKIQVYYRRHLKSR